MSELASEPSGRSELASEPSGRSRLRLGVVAVVIAGAIAFLLVQGLGNATTYFYNADEVAERADDLAGRPIRLQGTVVGEPVVDDERVSFTVEYRCAAVDVRHRGAPPELFRPGIPVVLEGRLDDAAVFQSDRIIVRHTSEYRTAESDRLDLAADEACPSRSRLQEVPEPGRSAGENSGVTP